MSVDKPSTVITEKCAIIPGEKANRARAKLAAPSENHLRVVRHNAIPRITPKRTLIGRPVQAINSGEGVVARTCSHSYQKIWVFWSSNGAANRMRAIGGWSFR